MTRNDLIDELKTNMRLTTKEAGVIVTAALEAIKEALSKGEEVSLNGFGAFATATRAAREGRNPRTGDVVNIPEAKVIKFRPSKTLKNTVS